MADSLQDQLRALGLAKAGKAERGSRGQDPRKSSTKGVTKAGKAVRQRPATARSAPRADGELPLEQAWALRELEEQRQAQQARDRKRAEERRRREINDSIRSIVEAHRLNRDDAEIARNFMFRGRIRKLYVTPGQQQALSEGRLGIVYLAGGYHLLAAEQLDAVSRIDTGHVVDLGAAGDDEDQFPVPDDLVW
jgi:uncharacterized protein YaiL (DUF2058 family)